MDIVTINSTPSKYFVANGGVLYQIFKDTGVFCNQ